MLEQVVVAKLDALASVQAADNRVRVNSIGEGFKPMGAIGLQRLSGK